MPRLRLGGAHRVAFGVSCLELADGHACPWPSGLRAARARVSVTLYWLLRAASILRWVPLRVAYWGALLASDLWWLLYRGHRQAAIANLTQVLGESTAARIAARRSFHNYGRYIVDFVRADMIRDASVPTKIQFDRWAELDAAVAEGHGVLIVLMHVGNWEIGGRVLSQRGYRVNVIARSFEHHRFNQAVVDARQESGMRVIPAERATLGIVRAMRRGEVLGILIDDPLEDGGVSVPFFGRQVMVPAGPARIALRTGARVLPSALVRDGTTSDVTRALVDFSVRAEVTGDQERDVQTLTRRILESHERFIRAYPDQWFMFRRMWPSVDLSHATEPALATHQASGGD